MSVCRGCRGHRERRQDCTRCGGNGRVCDDPHGPDERACGGWVIGWSPGRGDFCHAHRPDTLAGLLAPLADVEPVTLVVLDDDVPF